MFVSLFGRAGRLNKRILILGNRTLAEELADIVSEIPDCEVAGFVENMDPELCKKPIAGFPVYWVDEIAKMADDHLCVCGIATTHRSRYVKQVRAMGMRFATLVHPTARVSSRADIGEGCFISPMAVVSSNTTLGEQVFVNRGALIGHHTKIGSFVTVQPGANIAGMVTIGDGAYIGMGSTIIDWISVGQNCIVGAGSVVVKDIPDAVQVVGVPAKIVKTDVVGK